MSLKLRRLLVAALEIAVLSPVGAYVFHLFLHGWAYLVACIVAGILWGFLILGVFNDWLFKHWSWVSAGSSTPQPLPESRYTEGYKREEPEGRYQGEPLEAPYPEDMQGEDPPYQQQHRW
jgi:hypothetical protein